MLVRDRMFISVLMQTCNHVNKVYAKWRNCVQQDYVQIHSPLNSFPHNGHLRWLGCLAVGTLLVQYIGVLTIVRKIAVDVTVA